MNEYQLIKQMGKCPKCGCTDFVINASVSGTVPYIASLIGEKCDNGDMYEGLSFRHNKWCICAKCGKRLFKYDDYIKENRGAL